MTDARRPAPTHHKDVSYSEVMKRALLATSVSLGLVVSGCGGASSGASAASVAALDQVVPPVGAAAPAVTLTAADGRAVALGERWSSANRTVVVFYRGFF